MTFVLVALMAALLGFGGVAGAGAATAQLLFWFALFVIFLTVIGTVMKHVRWRW